MYEPEAPVIDAHKPKVGVRRHGDYHFDALCFYNELTSLGILGAEKSVGISKERRRSQLKVSLPEPQHSQATKDFAKL